MKKKENSIKSDLQKLSAQKDEEIDYSDSPPLDDSFFTMALSTWSPTPAKKMMTIRLDADLFTWLKSQGKGYQTKINALLREYMEHQLQSHS